MLNRSLRIFTVVCFVLPAVALFAQDFAAPEGTLEAYIDALRTGDKEAVLKCFYPEPEDFYLSGPIPVESYIITNKTTFGESHVEEWNSSGIIPPAEIGDIDLEVEEKIHGKIHMFSYLMREVEGDWKIVAHCGWGDQ